MSKIVGWFGLAVLFICTYIPPISSLPVWETEVYGIPAQSILWLAGPVLALGCISMIIFYSVRETK